MNGCIPHRVTTNAFKPPPKLRRGANERLASLPCPARASSDGSSRVHRWHDLFLSTLASTPSPPLSPPLSPPHPALPPTGMASSRSLLVAFAFVVVWSSRLLGLAKAHLPSRLYSTTGTGSPVAARSTPPLLLRLAALGLLGAANGLIPAFHWRTYDRMCQATGVRFRQWAGGG